MEPNLWLKQVTGVKSWHYHVPLIQPLRTAHQNITHRSGVLLQWQIQDNTYYSDLCPLPGFNKESLDQCLLELKSYLTGSVKTQVSAPVDLAINSVGWQYLNAAKIGSIQSGKPISICNLVSADQPLDSDLSNKTCIKIKVGLDSIASDIKRINDICTVAKLSKIRLDASGQWTDAQLNNLLAQIDVSRIEYIEDPFKKLADYDNWNQRFSIPFALDELVADCLNKLEQIQRPYALIIKPLFIGLGKSLQLIEQAKKQNIKIVLSSGYESSINLNFYCWLVRHYNLIDAQGLDTAKYWQAHLLQKPEFIEDTKTILELSDLQYLGQIL